MRKFRFFTLSLLAICCSCNFYGDVNLGGGFRYMVEPPFNDIVKSSTYVIQDVEELGFNEDYILATTLSGDSLIYWIIDKTKKSKELAHDVDSKLKFSNVTIVDTAIWNSIRRQYNIEVKSKYDYQKEAGYNKQ